ncbi:MAG: hypothetical protein MZV64_09275 [Ignavibacteriales bacterium]|nr:hypothetical protein [Ignavibacteriales bacterium]
MFDFRSLYPSVMRTFNVDPLAFRLAAAEPRPDDIEALNGARFRREPGILPAVIERYFAERLRAIEGGRDGVLRLQDPDELLLRSPGR